jgi:hypothetical protein
VLLTTILTDLHTLKGIAFVERGEILSGFNSLVIKELAHADVTFIRVLLAFLFLRAGCFEKVVYIIQETQS